MGQKSWAFACALTLVALVAPRLRAEEPTGGGPFAAPTAVAAEPERKPHPARDSLSTSDANVVAAHERIDEVLDQPLRAPLDFAETPLNQVTNVLQEEYDIPIVFDTTALDAIASSPEVEVSVEIAHVTLRTALDLMLRGVEDLTYIIDGEVLLITTAEEADKRLQVRVYRVDDLTVQSTAPGPGATASADFNPLVELITTNVERDSWLENGTGEGDIRAYPPGMIVISQTHRVHRQVAGVLAALRAIKADVLADAARSDAANSTTSVTRGFSIVDESLTATDESREVLQKAISASTNWLADAESLAPDDVFIHVLPRKVIVRHRPQVVERVEQVLANIGATSREAPATGGGFGGSTRGNPQQGQEGSGRGGRRGGGGF